MIRYVVSRILTAIAMLVLLSAALFVVLRIIPGDPTVTKAGGMLGNVNKSELNAVRQSLGLKRPLVAQYVTWVAGALRGNFGRSYFSQYPVTDLIADRVAPTLELTFASLLIAIAFAIVLGLLGARYPRFIATRMIGGVTATLLATPPFVLGIAFVLLFAVRYNIMPARGYVAPSESFSGFLHYLALPSLTLGLTVGATLLVHLRASLEEAMRAPYIRTARGKGVGLGQIVLRHAFPNSLLPTLTLMGMTIGYLLGGVVVVEFVFGWPGMGSLVVNAVDERDYPTIQAIVMIIAVVFIVINLAVDLLYGIIDPRIRRSKGNA